MRGIFLVFIFLLSFPCLACSSENQADTEPLKFCVFPNKNPKILVSLYTPVAQKLSEAIGREVKLVTAPDRKAFDERALAGEYDLAVACVACYFKLYDKAGYRAIVRGEPSFKGSVFVRKESPVTDPMQLQGKEVAAIGRHSYAGYVFFQAHLVEHGGADLIQPHFNFLKKPDSVIFSVLNGKNDAGVVRIDLLKSPKFAQFKDQVRVLMLSSDIPHFPFIVPGNMDPQLVSKITEALTGLTSQDPVAKKLFKAMKYSSLQAVSDSDYDSFKNEYRKAQKLLPKTSK